MGKHKVDRCGDCGAREGSIHELGCDMEQCPFCGNQLITCDCAYKMMGLVDESKYGPETAHLPKRVFENGLSASQAGRWLSILEKRGRVPFINYPVLCAKCGQLWPEFFQVPDEEWERYIQIDIRNEVICRPCYDHIRALIDNANRRRAR